MFENWPDNLCWSYMPLIGKKGLRSPFDKFSTYFLSSPEHKVLM